MPKIHKYLKRFGYIVSLPAVATLIAFLWSKQSDIYKDRVSLLKEKNVSLSEDIAEMKQMYEVLTYSRSLEELSAQKQLYETLIESLSGKLSSIEEQANALRISVEQKEDLLARKSILLKEKENAIVGYQAVLALMSNRLDEQIEDLNSQPGESELELGGANAEVEEIESEPSEYAFNIRYLGAMLTINTEYMYEGYFPGGEIKIYSCWVTNVSRRERYIDCGVAINATERVEDSSSEITRREAHIDQHSSYITSSDAPRKSSLLAVIPLVKLGDEILYTLRFENASPHATYAGHSMVLQSTDGETIHLPNFNINLSFGSN